MTQASFFSGFGGFDLPADWMGWENAFHCEINPFARRILEYYWTNATSYEDITKADFSIWRNKIDIITGGFPCQPFSNAGNRKGTDDMRYLWPAMCKAIDIIRPAWVIGENVAGLLSMAGEPGNDPEVFFKVDRRNIARLQEVDSYEAVFVRQEKMLLQNICKDLEKIGYSVQPFIVPAAAVGAPHRRDRIWIVANANEIRSGGSATIGNIQKKDQAQRSNIFKQTIGSGLQRIITHTNGTEQEYKYGKDHKTKGEIWGNKAVHVSGELFGNGNASNAADIGTRGIRNQKEKTGPRKGNQLSGGQCGVSNKEGAMAYPNGKRHEECQPFHITNKQGQYCGKNFNRESHGWVNFPTQPPICSGDDGVSSQLDGITFSNWRNESIKGYGNAIVPQVAYEFYKAIQIAENERLNQIITP